MNYLMGALAQADNLEQMLIESGGELTDSIMQVLTITESQLINVVDTTHLKMERLEKVAEFYASKAEQYARLASSIEKSNKFTKQIIKDYMMNSGKTELSGTEFSFKLARTAPVFDVTDETKLPAEYIKEKVEKSVDKKRIAEDLKLGVKIEGVILKENYSLRSTIKKG